MAAQQPPIFLQAERHPAEDVRRGLISAVWPGGGVVEGLEVTENDTPNLSVNVHPGMVVIPGTEASYQGAYVCENRGVVNLAIDAYDGTVRTDLIVARVYDSGYGVAADDKWALEVVRGDDTAWGAGDVPDNAIILGEVTVSAGTGTTILDAAITDRRFTRYLGVNRGGWATARGGIRKFPTISEVPTSGWEDGDAIYIRDTGRLLVREQGDFYPPWNSKWGSVGYKEYADTQGGITTATDLGVGLDALAIAWTAVAGRRYRVTVKALFTVNTNGAEARLLITDGSDNQLQSGGVQPTGTTRSHLAHLELRNYVPGAGATAVKARALCSGGTAALIASAQSPAYIEVEDDGPAASPAS